MEQGSGSFAQGPGDGAPAPHDAVVVLKRVHELCLRLLHAETLAGALGEVLDAGLELTRADFGTVQLRDPHSGHLELVAQRGFAPRLEVRVQRLAPDDPHASARAARSGSRVIVADVADDAGYVALGDFCAAFGFRSTQATPLHGAQGEVLGVLSTMFRQPRHLEAAELEALDLYARSAILAIERIRARDAASASQRRFPMLFDSFDQGFCVVEVLFDASGRPADYRFLECNPAFERQSGLHDAVGRTIRELVPEMEAFWVQVYGRVALTGEPVLFDHDATAMQRSFRVYAFPADAPSSRHVAIFFKDITHARLSEARDRFLVALEAATRELDDPERIADTAMRLLADHLRVDRAVYAEASDDAREHTVVGEYSPRLPSIRGTHRIADYGESYGQALCAGRSFVFGDLREAPLDVTQRRRMLAHRVQAMIHAPLLKGGRLRASVAVQHGAARTWREQEIEAVHAVGARCWEAIERARVTRELRHSQARLQQLADSLPLIAWECDPDGSVVWLNLGFSAYTGRPEAEYCGWAWQGVIDPRDLPLYVEGWQRALRAQQPYTAEARMRGRDGQMRWFLLRSLPVFDAHGALQRWYGGATDIDDLKRVQARLVETEEQFRTLANLLPQFIWTARPDGSIDWFNDYAHAFFGPGANIEGMGWAGYHDPDLIDAVKDGYFDALRSGTPYSCTTRFRNAAGEYRWFMAQMVPQRDAQGRVLRFLGYNIDVTALHETQARLIEADRRKDEFLATLGHELRNPLAPLRNALEIMKRRPEGADAGLRQMMQRQLDHMVRLVDDLLDASRITRGVVELRRERVALAEVLHLAVETSRPLIEAHAHRLDVAVPDTPLWVHADAVRLTQVFANLLNNAARYTPDGGSIEVIARAEDADVVVDVRDTGVGIAPDMLARVFELFTQGDRRSPRAQDGLGIGLHLSRSLVQLHGGSLTVSSAGAHRGSTFRVRLPRDAGDTAPHAEAPVPLRAASPPPAAPPSAH